MTKGVKQMKYTLDDNLKLSIQYDLQRLYNKYQDIKTNTILDATNMQLIDLMDTIFYKLNFNGIKFDVKQNDWILL